jgi:hypothetical protein
MQKGRDLLDRGLFLWLGLCGAAEGLIAGKPGSYTWNAFFLTMHL